MALPVTYLFDPFCGWCYGAAPVIAQLRKAVGDDRIQGLPVGLFAGEYARPMGAEFRDYAWTNDQRIAAMTGQTFSQAYFDQVLSDFDTPLDSGPPTLAFAVAERLRQGSGLALLERMQRARFVEGRNLCSAETLLDLAAELGHDRAKFKAAFDGREGAAALETALAHGEVMMRHLGLRGVPAVAVSHGNHFHPIAGEALLDPKQGLAEKIAAQLADPHGGHAHA
jgi:putative protein-disulfide isomerase